MITIKRGDSGIGLRATLTNEKGNVDLTDANVLFLFGKNEIKCELKNAENGIVDVILEEPHTEKAGIYCGEFEVHFSDGRAETFPNDGYIKLHIYQDLGGRI